MMFLLGRLKCQDVPGLIHTAQQLHGVVGLRYLGVGLLNG